MSIPLMGLLGRIKFPTYKKEVRVKSVVAGVTWSCRIDITFHPQDKFVHNPPEILEVAPGTFPQYLGTISHELVPSERYAIMRRIKLSGGYSLKMDPEALTKELHGHLWRDQYLSDEIKRLVEAREIRTGGSLTREPDIRLLVDFHDPKVEYDEVPEEYFVPQGG